MKDLLANFKGADTSAFPDIALLSHDRLQVLWILSVANTAGIADIMTPFAISEILREIYGFVISRQMVAGILNTEQKIKTVAKKKKGGKIYFQIMQPGLDVISSASSCVVILPEQALTSIRKIEDLLQSLKGQLQICDPYVNSKTVDYLANCHLASQISHHRHSRWYEEGP